MRRVLVILILIVAAAAGGSGYWWYTTYQAAMTVEPLGASGSIEAEEVSITAEAGGRIVELSVDEGSEVTKGDVLVQLDTTILLAQKAQAQAAVETARANLAQVKAGPRASTLSPSVWTTAASIPSMEVPLINPIVVRVPSAAIVVPSFPLRYTSGLRERYR